jgi:GT2 family glycosyltransferase
MTLVSKDHCPLPTGDNAHARNVSLPVPSAESERQQARPPRLANWPTISVVVVTWNARKYVDECLRSLYEDNVIPVEVIVVDNASTDGSPDLVAREFPSFRVLRNLQNLGFARANNIGIRESHGEYVCLLNSDVVLSRGTLYALYQFMQANPRVAIAGPQMRGADGSVRRSSMRHPSLLNALARAFAIDNLGFVSRRIGGQMMTDFSHREIVDVDILNGWFWFIRRQALNEVGLLDERFFMYGEDMDWCYRFRKAGWRLVFNPAVNALHYGGGSSRAAPLRFYVEMHRANLQYWIKHHGRGSGSVYCAIIFLHHAIRLAANFTARYLCIGNRDELAAGIRRSRAVLLWMMRIRPIPS